MGQENSVIFDIFGENFDRFSFPANIHRVTAGYGGEALLIIGSEKSALIDCGMAYCGKKMVENLQAVLKQEGKENLDYVLLSHSHYDHIGALPYIKDAYPQVVVCGSEHCRKILEKPSAHALMKELGTSARELYEPANQDEIPVHNLKVDRVMVDGDIISLGEEWIVALETKGHTDCCLSYVLEPLKLLFASESAGILEGKDYVNTPFLKSFRDAVNSSRRCRAYGVNYICLSHFGMLPQSYNETYWDMLFAACDEKYDFIAAMVAEGLTEEQMLERYTDHYWSEYKAVEQPREAYLLNSGYILKTVLKELDAQKKR